MVTSVHRINKQFIHPKVISATFKATADISIRKCYRMLFFVIENDQNRATFWFHRIIDHINYEFAIIIIPNESQLFDHHSDNMFKIHNIGIVLIHSASVHIFSSTSGSIPN